MTQREAIEQKLVWVLKQETLPPEGLFERAGVLEEEARDVLASLVDSGKVIVGRGWKLRLA